MLPCHHWRKISTRATFYLGIKMNLYTVASPPPHSYIGPSWQIVDFNNLFTRSSEQSRCFPFTQHFSVFLLSQLQHRLTSAKRLHIVRPIGISGPSSLNTRLWKVQCQLLANSRLIDHYGFTFLVPGQLPK